MLSDMTSSAIPRGIPIPLRPQTGPRNRFETRRSATVTDSFGRKIDYLRISVTDRCNLRCLYCMPEGGIPWKPHGEILTFEELERFVVIAAKEGISKIRLTGGEPLVRKGLVDFVGRLGTQIPVEKVALTTNGVLLSRFARQLADRGLSRVNVSLDSLNPLLYTRVTRGGELRQVLEGIDAALRVGMNPVKINVVILPGLDQDLLSFAKLTLDKPLHVRFIEPMPLGGVGVCAVLPEVKHGGKNSAEEVLARLSTAAITAGIGRLESVGTDGVPEGWGPARYYRFQGAAGTVGFISPRSRHFCGQCNRLRLTADGKIRPCLFGDEEFDARAVLRWGTDDDVRHLIRHALAAKPEGHEGRAGTVRHMSQIGG